MHAKTYQIWLRRLKTKVKMYAGLTCLDHAVHLLAALQVICILLVLMHIFVHVYVFEMLDIILAHTILDYWFTVVF